MAHHTPPLTPPTEGDFAALQAAAPRLGEVSPPPALRVPGTHLPGPPPEDAFGLPDTLSLHANAEEGATPAPAVPSAEEILGQRKRITDLCTGFAIVMEKKLLLNAEKRGWREDWNKNDWEAECRDQLLDHVLKGDPRDVGILAAFAWFHDWNLDPLSDGSQARVLTRDQEAYHLALGRNVQIVGNERAASVLAGVETLLQQAAAKAFLLGHDHEAVSIRGLLRDVQETKQKLTA